MIPLNYILKKCNGGNELTKLQEKMNYLIILSSCLLKWKIFGNSDTNNKNIKLGHSNRTSKSRKNQNACRKEKLQILGNTGSVRHKKADMKENIECHWQRRKLLKTKPCSSNLIKGINTGICHPYKILSTILKMDHCTKKPMTIHKSLHLKDDRLRVKKRRREMTCQHWEICKKSKFNRTT